MRAERAGQLTAVALGGLFLGWLVLRGDDGAAERARLAAEAEAAAAAARAEAAAERERWARSRSERASTREGSRVLRDEDLASGDAEAADAQRDRVEADGASSDPLRKNQVLPIRLNPLAKLENRAVAEITGLDPDAPRELVAWRKKNGRYAILVRGESDEDGQLQFPPVVAAGGGLEVVITDADSRPELPGASEVRRLAPRPPEPPQGRVLEAYEGEALVRIVSGEASGEVLLADIDGTVFARYPVPRMPTPGARVFDVALELYGDDVQVLMAHEFEDGRRSDWRALAVDSPLGLDAVSDFGEIGEAGDD